MNIRTLAISLIRRSSCLLFLILLQHIAVLAKPEAGTLQTDQIFFKENKGQITDQYSKRRTDIGFSLATPGLSVFVGSGHLHYQWVKLDIPPQTATTKHRKEAPQATTAETYRLDMVLEGANTNAQPVTTGKQEYYDIYYTGQLPDGAIIHSYKTVVYRNIYPNIDWVLNTGKDGLKYDFIVHPGGNPRNIRMRYAGHTSLGLKDGAMTAVTPMGAITEKKPYTYDAVTGKELSSAFVQEGHTISFNVAPSSHTIVIDPVISWGTQYGGSAYDWLHNMAASTSGDVCIVGQTNSINNIATSGTYNSTIATYQEAFAAKFNSSGVRQWGIYFGGADRDIFHNVCFDKLGNIYASGSTISNSGIATSGAFVPTYYGAGFTGMLIKFNGSGIRQWGTYINGGISDLACDTSGNVYINGGTSAYDIGTAGTFKQFAGNTNCCLLKFNASGARVWGTYLGNRGNMAVSRQGNVYIFGTSGLKDDFITTGSFQPTVAGLDDCFLTKFDGTGNLVWGTYFGSTGPEDPYDICCDTAENIYICGSTKSYTGLASTGAFKTATALTASYNNMDAFVASFNKNGARNWSTYFGSRDDDNGNAIAVGADGAVYLAGSTLFSNYLPPAGERSIIYGPAPQPMNNGSNEAYIARISNNGTQVDWGTFYGTWDSESVSAIATDGGRRIYIAGERVATVGSWPSVQSYDGFVACLYECIGFSHNKLSVADSAFCRRDSIALGAIAGPYTYTWLRNDTVITGQTNDSLFVKKVGKYRFVAKNAEGCPDTSRNVVVAEDPLPNASLSYIDTSFCAYDSIKINAQPGIHSYTWLRNDTAINSVTSDSLFVKTSGTYRLAVVSAEGCTDTSKQVIAVVHPLPAPVITRSNMFDLSTGTFVTYQWLRDGVVIPNATDSVHIATSNGSYTVLVTDSNGCSNLSPAMIVNNVGIQEYTAQGSISIYPNPVTDIITVNGVNEGNYTITDVLGRTLAKGAFLGSRIPTGNIPVGNYMLHITHLQHGEVRIKFIKN